MAFLKSFNATLVCLFLLQFVHAQNSAGIEQQWQRYQDSVFQEKLYVHTDKNTYLAGDIVWFSLYNVVAANHQPAGLSKIAYVEVLDARNKVITQAKIGIKEGRGSGSAFLPLTTTSGNYKLRAYTAWMKNFDTEQFFEKPIVVLNTLKNLEVSAVDTAKAAIHIFPEGGNLVAGIESKVAVKVTAHNGQGIDFSGVITNEKGDTLTRLAALKFGIGTFLIKPEAAHTYTIIIRLSSGTIIKQELPKAFAQGYVMRVQNTGGGTLDITVNASSDLAASSVYLFAHNRKKVQQAELKRILKGQAVFQMDTATLAEGITHFTVFTEDRKPVCERLYFKKPAQKFQLEAASDQQQYGARKKVEIKIHTKEGTDSALAADLSLSVYKMDALQPVSDVNIINYLWLTSELSGAIEAPDYYFSTNENLVAATDNLMLTHGWRRYRWEAVLNSNRPAFAFPAEFNGHLIKAIVTDAGTGQPAAGVQTYLSIPGNPFQLYVAESNATGVVQFDVKGYYGAGDLIFQANTQNGSNYRVAVQSPFAQTYSNNSQPPYTFSKAHAGALLQQSIGMQVQNIYRKDSLSTYRLPDVLDTIPFYGRADYSYSLDVYTRFQTMEEVLREYVRPINVLQRKNGLHLLLFNDPQRQFFDGGELVMLDGIPLFDKDKIFAYDPLKVKKLDVVSRKFFMGPVLFNGIASFTTYTGTYEGFSLDPKAIVIDYEGLQLERAFYAPVYETEQQYQNRLPDFRNTLFWKPLVKTDKKGEATVQFYTSDQKGRYQVAIEGINEKGEAAVGQFQIEVK